MSKQNIVQYRAAALPTALKPLIAILRHLLHIKLKQISCRSAAAPNSFISKCAFSAQFGDIKASSPSGGHSPEELPSLRRCFEVFPLHSSVFFASFTTFHLTPDG